MAGITRDIGTGSTVTFGTSSFTSEILSIGWSGIAREAIDVTHLSTAVAGAGKFGSRTFIPTDLTDPGEISLELHFDPDQDFPIEGVAETITVTFPVAATGETAANWAGTGFVTSFDITVPLEDKMVGTMTIKMTGNITMTDATS